MWLISEYQPVGLFSLKHALATSSGGKSLLVPTPFALKMALLDAAFRLRGAARAEALWPALRDLPVALRPPERVVVTNLFTRVLKPRRNPARPGTPHAGPLGKTIAFREYAWSEGDLSIAVKLAQDDQLSDVTDLFLQINYLGKRGGFVQLSGPPQGVGDLPPGFLRLNPENNQMAFDSRGLLQMLDGCGPKMTFEHANIYSNKRIALGKERVLHHVVLPYRLVRSSKSYSFYERIDEEASRRGSESARKRVGEEASRRGGEE
jgi:hypothetical protein